MGDTCTRACGFCDVITGKPKPLDPLEPLKISSAVKKLNLKQKTYIVILRKVMVNAVNILLRFLVAFKYLCKINMY